MTVGIRVTYRPVRARYHDIFNIGSDLFGPGKPADWAIIEEVLRKECKSEITRKMNCRVAKALHEFSIQSKITGHPQEFRSLSMSEDAGGIKLWISLVLIIDEKPTIVVY